MLFLVLFVLIVSSVICEKSSKWCGVPPMCQCFNSMKIIKCEDIRILPRLTKEDARNTRLLILMGQIQKIPAAIFNRTVFASLEKVNLMETNILCTEQKDGIICISRLCRSTNHICYNRKTSFRDRISHDQRSAGDKHHLDEQREQLQNHQDTVGNQKWPTVVQCWNNIDCSQHFDSFDNHDLCNNTLQAHEK